MLCLMKPYGWRYGALDYDKTDTLLIPVVIKRRARRHGRAIIAEQLDPSLYWRKVRLIRVV